MAATTHAQVVKNDTRDFITTATLQLLGIKKTSEHPSPLSDLTVSKICKRAGVSRMAFYRNFESIEQVLYDYYQPKIKETFDIIRQTSEDNIKTNHQLLFFEKFNKDLYLAESQGYESTLQQIFTEEIEKFYSYLNNPYFTTFMAAGVYAVWRRWIMSNQDIPLERIHKLLQQLSHSIDNTMEL